MPKGVPLTEEEQQRRRKEIFDASAHLFLENGFNETSMREIANAAGIGKSTLYDYFKTKDDIMVSYFENELEQITERAQTVMEQKLNVTEKLRKIMQMHLEYLVDNKNFYLKLSIEAQRLSIESQQRIQTRRYAYQDMLRDLDRGRDQIGRISPCQSTFGSPQYLHATYPWQCSPPALLEPLKK